jgi:UDP-glucuronate 4-epimerase
MSAPERILVTGAAGFIGSTLVDALLGAGRSVVGLDSFDPFYPEELKHRNLVGANASKDFELIRGDIRDPAALDQALTGTGIDCIVHLAAKAGVRPSLEEPALYADVNVNGTSVVLEAAARHEVPRVVFASSSSVYGERDSGPFSEDDRVDRPISPYAATKRACELIAHSFHYAHGFDVSCIRFFTAYGPRQRPDLAIRRFAERMRRGEPLPIYGDGSALRDYTFVGDVVAGLVQAIDASLGFAILNFGAGKPVTVMQLIEQLELAMGVKAEKHFEAPRTGDVPRTWADITAAQKAIGYAPRVGLEEGLARFAEWLDGEPSLNE